MESGLFQLACQNLHFSSIATLITSVALFDDSVSFSFFVCPLDVREWVICFLLGWWILGDCSSKCTLDGQTAGHAQEGDCQQRSSARPFQKRLLPLTTQQVFVHPISITNLKISFSFLQVPNPLGFVEFFWFFLQCELLRMTSGTYTQIMGCLIFFTVLVVGGGGLGMEVVRSFAKAGSWVTAYQRGEKFRKEIEELGAMLAIGDVLDVGAIEKTLRGNSFDAIVCTVGRLPVRLPSQYFQINWLEEFPCLALLDFLLSSQQFSFHLHSGFLCNFLQGCFISCNFSVALLCSLQLSTRRWQSPC